MSRPGFVLEVDDRTPQLLTMSGAQLRLDRLGVGTHVVYAADAEESSDPVPLIDSALSAPQGTAALLDQLHPDLKLTLVVVDTERPLPQPRFDPRRTLAEQVLALAARAGVTDVEVVIANGLRKRWNSDDITRVLGDRVATSFLPDGLITSHDVTGADLVTVGEVDGVPVRLNRRVAQSDLAVVIGLRADNSDGCALSAGLTDVATINRIGGADGDPQLAVAVGRLVTSAVNTFALTAVLGQPLFDRTLRFTSKREWEWTALDRLAFAVERQVVAGLPRRGAQIVRGALRADYPVIDVLGGTYETVLTEARDVWQAANAVETPGPADVLVTSVWGAGVDESDPIGSPLDAAHHALVRQAGSHLGSPFVREDGVLIAMHPLRNRFSNRRQSAASDFFAKVLTATLDPQEIAAAHEAAAISDEWYLDLYRKHHGAHPLHVFHQWYDIARAAARLGDVIWVGGDRRSAAVLGHRSATTYADALEIASDRVGPHPSITVLRGAGLALGDVR